MPQLENGYTKIANELLEAWARIRIPGEAQQVLNVIIRKTYGYRKKEDKIALSQFSSYTGLRKRTVCKALKKLKDLNLITQLGDGSINSYRINKDFFTWRPSPKKGTIPQLGDKVSPILAHTKETYTKEISDSRKKRSSGTPSNKGKKMLKHDPRKTDADYEDVITQDGDHVDTRFDLEAKAKAKLTADVSKVIKAYEDVYVATITAEKSDMPRMTVRGLRSVVKSALKLYTADEIISFIPAFFDNDFYRDTKWPLWTLCSTKVLNQLKNQE